MTIDPCCSGPAEGPVGLGRRHLLVGGAAGAVALALSAVPTAASTADSKDGDAPDAEHPEYQTSDYGFDAPRPASEVHRRPMMFPVLGQVSWSDTYLAPRGDGRQHEGQDLMGSKMQKLLACVTGTIVELRHRSTGNSLYLKGDDGWYYCYLHINNDRPGTDDGSNSFANAFAPGMATGTRVTKGQHIAYLGDSGNAEGTAPHCHFEIRMPNARWYNAAAVNAKYSLDAAEPARTGPAVPPEAFTPWNNSQDLIRQQYTDFLGRIASPANLAYWGSLLDEGRRSPQQMMQFFLDSDECDQKTQAIARLYLACFLRRPDNTGFQYWTGRRRGGDSLTAIADFFARGTEFTNRYGNLGNRDFVARVYQNVLGRSPDRTGHDYWTGRLDSGMSRGRVMVHFSDSSENRDRQRVSTDIVAAYGCMLGRMPSSSDVSSWSNHLNNGGNNANMANLLRTSGEYRDRVT
jgi:murein DD-endopeptidase MepM/ murein hydrolase activator NlpD